jgi:DNA-directed RNA polymerase beta subunit
MVTDKMHSRGVGFANPHDQLTRQPTAGRSHMGGLRVGEMERDALLSHGLATFLRESMMDRSDKYKWYVCRHCGILVDYSKNCRNCNQADVSVVETPYATKVMMQELEAMGLQMRFNHVDLPVIDEAEDAEEAMMIATDVEDDDDYDEDDGDYYDSEGGSDSADGAIAWQR